jgi:hypothetical protein
LTDKHLVTAVGSKGAANQELVLHPRRPGC